MSDLPQSDLPPVLLTMPSWNGTIAAVRALGRQGIRCVVADPSVREAAAWSRHSSRSVRCPSTAHTDRFVEWLLRFGHENPGHAFCATSDDSAFAASAYQDQLRGVVLQDPPPLSALHDLLDKHRLYANAAAVGIATPETRFPDEAHAPDPAGLRFPLLIKPRIQAGSTTSSKGAPVVRPEQLAADYAAFRAKNRFAPEVLSRWPGVDLPMLQEYLPHEAQRILVISGFIDKRGTSAATRGALKVFSQPRYLGIGICFETAAVPPDLERAVLELCRRVGYYGVFQCEFIERGQEHLLIDFNPRFYNFMSFDCARGLPQSHLSYLLATGQDEQLEATLAKARAEARRFDGWVWYNRSSVAVQLALEALFGRIDRTEVERWRAWRKAAQVVIDPVWSTDDLGPALGDLKRRIVQALIHPRSFLRSNIATALPGRR